jgi:hypothetical protein
MGVSAEVFNSSNKEKETLNQRVTLLPEQIDYARERKNHLLEYLKSELSSRLDIQTGYWLQGSYKNHTLIRPVKKGEEFDIDAGIYLFFNAENKGVRASDAKQILRSVLSKYCAENSKAKLADSKPNCERIQYPGSFHIDLPLYYFDKETNACRLATDNSGWIDSDPKSLQDWFDDRVRSLSDSQKARLRRVIKNLKTWVCLKGVKLPSIAITVFIAERFDDFETDDDAFLQNGANLANHLIGGAQIISPINGDDLIGGTEQDITQLSQELASMLDNLQLALDSGSAIEAHPYWTQIFEHIYPPLAEIEESTSISQLPATTISPAINIRTKNKKGEFIVDSAAESIIAYIDEKLEFSVTSRSHYPANASVRWMVRNKDQDASIANDLGHQSVLEINSTCSEHCGYRGTHYMECFIEHNGIILGCKSIKIRISGIQRPQRNPPRQSYGVRR